MLPVSAFTLSAVDSTPRPSGFPSHRSAILLTSLPVWDTSACRSDLHILPRRLCTIRILASSSSAMVRADCCCCSGAFRAGLSYPFLSKVTVCHGLIVRPRERAQPVKAVSLIFRSVFCGPRLFPSASKRHNTPR